MELEVEEENEKSIFREYFGDSPQIKVLDFLIDGQDLDYSMTEIARGSEVGWSAFIRLWKRIVDKKIVIPTRTIGNARLFKLNKENLFVQKLIKLDWEITKSETDKFIGEKL